VKHFVYLDTDLINSYLAQIDDGLVNSRKFEEQRCRTEVKTEEDMPATGKSNISMGLSSLLGYQYNFENEYIKEINTISQTEAGKEILSKIIHDNSFDNLISYLNKNGLISSDSHKSPVVGDYLILNGNFKMIDLSFITSLIDGNFTKIYSSITSGAFDDAIKNMNRQQKRSNEFKAKEKLMKDKLDSELKTFDDVRSMIDFISKILPSDTYIIHNQILIPLTKKYLRENYISLRYKYSSESTIVGYITGDLKSIMDFKPNNELDDLFKVFDEMLLKTLEFLSIKDDFKVMHPIAWYFS